MIIGHGGFITEINSAGVYDVVPIYYPSINMEICTFPPPLRSCAYPPDKLLSLRTKMETYLNNIPPNHHIDDIFAQAVAQAQIDTITFRYGDEWSKDVNIGFHQKDYLRAENWVKGHRYFDKLYANADEIFEEGQSGFYVLSNNIGLTNSSTPIPFLNGSQTLSSFIDEMNHNTFGGIDNLFILDTTCSVPLNDLEERTDRLIRKNISTLYEPQEKGRIKGGQTRKQERRKNKKRKQNRNKKTKKNKKAKKLRS